jgi:hypothetical protein
MGALQDGSAAADDTESFITELGHGRVESLPHWVNAWKGDDERAGCASLKVV